METLSPEYLKVEKLIDVQNRLAIEDFKEESLKQRNLKIESPSLRKGFCDRFELTATVQWRLCCDKGQQQKNMNFSNMWDNNAW